MTEGRRMKRRDKKKTPKKYITLRRTNYRAALHNRNVEKSTHNKKKLVWMVLIIYYYCKFDECIRFKRFTFTNTQCHSILWLTAYTIQRLFLVDRSNNREKKEIFSGFFFYSFFLRPIFAEFVFILFFFFFSFAYGLSSRFAFHSQRNSKFEILVIYP